MDSAPACHCSRIFWIGIWCDPGGWCYAGQGVGLNDACSSLPTQCILWFYEIEEFSIVVAQYRYISTCNETDSIFGMQNCSFPEELFHLYILSKCNNKRETGCLKSIHASLLSTCILIECNCTIYFTVRQRHKISASLGFRMWNLFSLQYINFFLPENKRQKWHNHLQMLNNT